LLHQFYPPFTRIDFRFKVIPVCMLTVATSYLASEKKLHACRREMDAFEHSEDLKNRIAKMAEKRKHQQHSTTATTNQTPPATTTSTTLSTNRG